MEKPGFSAWILLFETRAFHNENLEKKCFSGLSVVVITGSPVVI